ncbi:hypothetical protein [Pseudomonas chlororaphis]|uniref:hypothetical protein n=1 Tax=Pseudomonas chlororaphis TaxID=587753 RepID=UPI0006A5DD17|nr:hypothetical protein [Pseudomonas chlororaphis]AZD01432.1 hypothetical protein C4K27_2238 [Pseudomonas chlororaphis subsp. chlororaphis]MBM0285116.1 hypothetical protein [Pseudomonas chlororaphis]MDO1505788.1 hypothetical protein [Pseudomonas chlororaphis]ORM49750.1 hypothetical protein B6D51_00995 [Pseudomonas chlororaphis subsp. chlororaphis]TWR99027.1 hypothetical protein FJD36_03405 [Pseudomonas chlororaphis subsp. chlororaphis]
MKISRLFCAAIPLVCIACSPTPLVYQPSDTSGKATGRVQPLTNLLPIDSHVRLIFVHGVGDHCPGYALDPETGWLSTENAAAMGLTPVSNVEPVAHFIDVSVYMKGIKDRSSGVSFAKKDYRLTLPDRAEVEVEAIEITWSSLTQWIKSTQLGYDSPSIFADKDSPPCLQRGGVDLASTVQAPWRVPINKTIKEQVFDRNLADAMLYAGTYRQTIERGLAEGLCHAVTPTADDAKCIWPSAQDSDRSAYKNLFVTHSLGSRMIYDMFLDLMSDAKENIIPLDERQKARPFIERMLADTPAFYMMANQLALLGLANVSPDIRSVNPRPLSNTTGQLIEPAKGSNGSSPPLPFSLAVESEAPGVPELPKAPSEPLVFDNVLLKIGNLKALAAAKTRRPVTKLEIVSFNDTNDLLTWHIPSWYDTAKASAPGRQVIHVTDVFVRNATRWLYLFEDPADAHVNYFNNPSVRNIIRCGAAKGKVSACTD